jgi:uncharacterized membrane protein
MLTDIIALSVIVLALDSVFLYTIRDYFKDQIAIVQKSPMRLDMPGAILCYVLIIAGIYYFIARHISASSQISEHAQTAFILGVFVYGVYELASKALLRNWKWTTVAMDTIWGGTMFALSTFAYHYYKKMAYKLKW